MTDLLEEPRSVGIVTHYYDHPHVAIVRFTEDVPRGAHVRFHGATTDFEEDLDSMEYDHRPVKIAKQGEEIGVAVTERVRQGDRVYVESASVAS